ncbi:MAG: hypothetical protein KAT68_12455 [Bacteroidales bacterium]|nr:hypothetical protein [Bacteroidales bacterium]
MSKTLSYLILILLLFPSMLKVHAQNNTSSPYSLFGIGDLSKKSLGQSEAFGGAAIGLRTPLHINIKNPASYSSLDSMTFIFEFGIKDKITKFQTETDEAVFDDFNINYFSFAFPVTRWWYSSLGLLPFSNVGYNIRNDISLPNNALASYNYFGSGGISQFYIGNSFKITKDLSFGFNSSYLFGALQHTNMLIFDDYQTRNSIIGKKTLIQDFYFDFGLQYTYNINDDYLCNIGVIYNHKTDIKAERTIISGATYDNWIENIDENILIDTIIDTVECGNIVFPSKIGFGVSLEKNNKFIVALDYSLQDWGNAKFFNQSDSLTTNSNIGIGIEYVPVKGHTKLYKRTYYRIGGHYTNSYLKINNHQINEFGISFGVGIPLKRSKTSINIAFEYGKRGTLENNLIKENYGIISINLSLLDIWFFKPKFN